MVQWFRVIFDPAISQVWGEGSSAVFPWTSSSQEQPSAVRAVRVWSPVFEKLTTPVCGDASGPECSPSPWYLNWRMLEWVWVFGASYSHVPTNNLAGSVSSVFVRLPCFSAKSQSPIG